MKYFIFAVVLLLCTQVEAREVRDNLNDRRNFVMVEYAPNSNHLSNDDAPIGGYNEDNDILIIKIGREYAWKPEWKYAVSIGYTSFDNSYNEDSSGVGAGLEAIHDFNRHVAFYAGGDFGFVSGYEDNVNDDFVIFDEYIPFVAFTTGLEFELNDYLPTLRGGVKYVPASIVGSDDVVALAVGTRFKF